MGDNIAVGLGVLSILIMIAFVIGAVVAWVTHVVYCIMYSMWILLVLGALIAPVGIIHGIMVWLGHGIPVTSGF